MRCLDFSILFLFAEHCINVFIFLSTMYYFLCNAYYVISGTYTTVSLQINKNIIGIISINISECYQKFYEYYAVNIQ